MVAVRAITLLASVGSAAAAFCDDYAASECAVVFDGCADAFAAMAAGDADAGNDLTEEGTQACVTAHLALVDSADSAHCEHARGGGVGFCLPSYCESYAASDCAVAFADCDTAVAAMAAGDADADNDLTEEGTVACLTAHLALAVADGTADSAHCAHARGGGIGYCLPSYCESYAASDCTAAFADCDTAVAAMPAGGDTDNDLTDAGTQACVTAHLALVDSADSAHCEHARGGGVGFCEKPEVTFCAAYAASECTVAFDGCEAAVGAMPAGDADAANDLTEAGTQACVIKHLALVPTDGTGADSAHCEHARGGGADFCLVPVVVKASGSTIAQPAAALAFGAAMLMAQ
jgi:hypothetical protein